MVPRCVILTVVTYCVIILTVVTYCEPNVSSLKPCPQTCLITQALPSNMSHHSSPAHYYFSSLQSCPKYDWWRDDHCLAVVYMCGCSTREEAGQPHHDKPHQGEPFPTHQLVPTGAVNHHNDRENITWSFTMLSESLVSPFIEKAFHHAFGKLESANVKLITLQCIKM